MKTQICIVSHFRHLWAKHEYHGGGGAQLSSHEGKEVFYVRSTVWKNQDTEIKKLKELHTKSPYFFRSQKTSYISGNLIESVADRRGTIYYMNKGSS